VTDGADGRFLDIVGAEKSFGAAMVLGGVDLAVGRGEFVSLLGPSGCGKTTLLRIVAGLLAPDRGTVRLDGEDVTRRPPHRRDVGVVFQNYALFPHLTVAENVAFGLEAHRVERARIRETVTRFLELVHLNAFADRSVKMLSGGQQQRVAVARALAVGPKLLLLDEPFSALDRKLRETMQIELKRLLRDLGTTAIFVTHDQDEALTMSDRIAVMNRGQIEQLDEPTVVYRCPATAFALGFVGLSSRLSGTVVEAPGNDEVAVQTSFGIVRGPGRFRRGSDVLVAVRPERLRAGATGANRIEARVRDIVFQGSKVQIHFQAPEGQQLLLEASELPAGPLGPDAPLTIGWHPEDTLIYPAETTP
jgi:putative spermidine/putrescine transport system ATP-binding protein